MIVVDVKGDISRLTEELAHLGATTKYIKIDMLRKTGRGALSSVKKGYKRYLRQPTGDLYRSYKVTTSRKKGFAIVHSPTRQYIASAMENGSTIKAKNYKYLTYRIGTQWFKSKSVTLKKSPFFSEGTDAYNRGQMQADISDVMTKAIAKFNAQTAAKG